MNSELINFPGEGYWEDSGEGGQYVMLVIPMPNDYTFHCSVDMSILMTRPDVCHTPNELWEPYHYHTSGYKKSIQAAEVLRDVGESDLAQWACQRYSHDELSTSVLAAVHLGSSCRSLVNGTVGYWTASYDDLTSAGRILWDTLKNVYGVEPMLLTFLDT